MAISGRSDGEWMNRYQFVDDEDRVERRQDLIQFWTALSSAGLLWSISQSSLDIILSPFSSAFFLFLHFYHSALHSSAALNFTIMSTVVSTPPSAAPLPSPVDRSSEVSSPNSFYTAPSPRDSFPPKPPSSRSSSAATLGKADVQGSGTNSIRIVTAATEDTPQQVHIIKVTDEAVHLQSASASTPVVHRVNEPFFHVVTRGEPYESNVGPPPPSPPASDGQPDEDQDEQLLGDATPLPPPKSEAPSTIPRSPRLSPSTSHNSSLAGPGPSTMSRRFRADDSPVLTQLTPSRRLPPLYTDGLLQPSPAPALRPPRRNTIGSAPRSPRIVGRASSHLTLALDDGELSEELVSDMQQQAEQIRRERLSKRVKQDAPQVLVGNLIGEGHVNYVMMYNMLTGIRIAVSRTQAKIKRPLTDEDYTARHKYSFDM